MLRVAVPNKGVLSEPAAEMLAESGYRQRRSTKDLAVYDPENDTEFFYLRPRDIAVYVAAGTLDVGITGRDMLLETAPADGEGTPRSRSCRWASAARRSASPRPVESGIERGRPARRQADRHRLPGAAAALPGRARHQGRRGQARRRGRDRLPARRGRRGLRRRRDRDDAARGRAAHHRRPGAAPARRSWSAGRAPRRSRPSPSCAAGCAGVLVARQYVMLDYDCPNELLEQATAITPGLEGPTVSPLQTPGWSAVRAMVRQTETNRVMDELWELGARAILVTSIHASRI